ncbi:MAG: penicillin acylase family protein, partial [Candidatus Latescibacterota bacterium]
MARPVLRSAPDLFPPRDRRRERRLRLLRILLAVVAFAIAAVLLAAAWLSYRLLRSRPLLDGEVAVVELEAPVRIERDALGVPSVTTESRLDASFALGFLHAQERFFQMDLLRRSAAGELAALIGPSLRRYDREIRVHRFRQRAQRIVRSLQRSEHAEAYARGVNAGLEALGAAPFEYLVLRSTPQAWQAEDVILCVLAMYIDLQSTDGAVESTWGVLADVLPEALVDLLAARGSEWDAPLTGDAVQTPPLPAADVYDLRAAPLRLGMLRSRRPGRSDPGRALPDAGTSVWWSADGEAVTPGSNNWAVAGSLAVDGGAILAGDMHLGLAVPNIWYRASLSYTDSRGDSRTLTGVTFPGTPALVSGSNGDVAWSFTNSMIDVSDLVLLEPVDGDPERYQTPSGPLRPVRSIEVIEIRGADDDTLLVLDTIWGPIVDRDHAGRRRAYRWVAHEVEAANFGLLDMEQARDLEEAI